MTVVAEPTYADAEHAAVNGAMLCAIRQACGPVLFASNPLQRASIKQAGAGLDGVTVQDIDVMPPGGVHLRRMRAQWRTLDGLARQHGPAALVLLSAGPETLFVARGLVERHQAMRVFAVMHGNLATVTGWRSRDPRRRLIDLRSGLALARHPRIRLIVLEEHIRTAAAEAGLSNRFLVWPLPSNAQEQAAPARWTPPQRLRLAFVGTANRIKGFADVLALARAAGPAYRWALAGKLGPEFRPEEIEGFELPSGPLDRPGFLREVRRADYAIMSFGPDYRLTASGSLMDCVAQRKPIIAVGNPALDALQRRFGPIGHVCPDLDAAARLLAEPARLRDPDAYAAFQRALDRVQADRLPQSLACIVRRDLGC